MCNWFSFNRSSSFSVSSFFFAAGLPAHGTAFAAEGSPPRRKAGGLKKWGGNKGVRPWSLGPREPAPTGSLSPSGLSCNPHGSEMGSAASISSQLGSADQVTEQEARRVLGVCFDQADWMLLAG